MRAAAGKVRLVKINVDENQQLAAQLRVQSVPTVYAFFGGRPVDAFTGAQPESKLRTFVERLTKSAASPLDEALELAQEAMENGDPRGAIDGGAIQSSGGNMLRRRKRRQRNRDEGGTK